MSSRPSDPPFGRPVPGGRLSRLARFGGIAGGVAGGALIDGARRFARGERPRLENLLLTPGNALRVANRLAEMRGAAMKIGQLLSMDAGDFLPAELASIMERLRADAEPMPRRQLEGVLDAEWGAGWRARFEYFSFRPLAAASIGQVHRALTADGRDLAVKVQYPGVRRSIDSDVDNVALLLRTARLVPPGMDVAPLLAEAKRQLHEEADYEREARCIERFGALLADDPAFAVPAVHADLSTRSVLAMSFLEGAPIEDLAGRPQPERDRAATRLIDLALRELFRFRLMQTDPNLANYRIGRGGGRIALLDFGATRSFPDDFVARYRRAVDAAFAGERPGAEGALEALGAFAAETSPRLRGTVTAMFLDATAPLRADGVYDFADPRLVEDLHRRGLELAVEREFLPVPPVDALFLQRKFGGLYLLARRLRARVDVRALIEANL